MIERILKLYEPINSALLTATNIKNKNDYLLTEIDKQYLVDYMSIFKIFIKISTFLQGQKYTTIQYIIPYIFQIRRRLLDITNNSNIVSYINLYNLIYLLILFILGYFITRRLS